MRTSEDVLRSAKKYLAELVIPDFEVRLSSEEGAWERPFARVAFTTPMWPMARGSVTVDIRRTLQVVAWPKVSDTPDEARLAAERLNEQFFLAFAKGLLTDAYHQNRAHPLRLPIWDYSEVTVAADDDDREATDFARIIEQPDIGDIDDPDTENSRLVIVNLRLEWSRSIAVEQEGVEVHTVGYTPAPPATP